MGTELKLSGAEVIVGKWRPAGPRHPWNLAAQRSATLRASGQSGYEGDRDQSAERMPHARGCDLR